VPSRGESALAGSPARSKLLRRRSEEPAVTDKEVCFVKPEGAESPICMFDPAGGQRHADSMGLGSAHGAAVRREASANIRLPFPRDPSPLRPKAQRQT